MTIRSFLSPGLILCLSDCFAVLASCAVAFTLRFVTGGIMPWQMYFGTLPWLAVFPLLYFMLTLYPGTFLRRQDELKRLSVATTVGFLCIVFFTFLTKEGQHFSRLALLLAWMTSLFAVPAARNFVRNRCRRFVWWAVPCVMFGNDGRIMELCDALSKARGLGVRPAVLVLDQNAPLPDLAPVLAPADTVMVERIPLADPEAATAALEAIAHRYAKAYAVVSFDSSNAGERQAWLDIIDHCFQRIILIPDMAVGGRVWHMAVSIGRLSGILMSQNLLDPRRMFLKRCMDCLLTLLAGIVAFPAMLVLAVAIRRDSPGPAFFKQQRIGRNGKHFSVYKFRTMAVNAAELLEKHLAENPEAREEWEKTQKLKNDPRITRVGHLLRKTSLDELPQILNVLRGEMSLVGPRPIVDNEIARYGKAYALYTRVRPGITGLWQVSGRNDLPYADRVWLDRHYVCNWSVWLDILIIARTVPEVLHCSGAY
ncbi:Exopolysaccharide biosynthesis protein [uncultured delta proteobacterium]|uniref:Exopolysaccharide biosynthesis protein n=1 Tax=uncultured delta proteobacterium TaxID=34034 RepID=A0A212KD87_9DELT|nr:Exopolysaccharide biosynthesis protein [uncultured delta proteobacterium]